MPSFFRMARILIGGSPPPDRAVAENLIEFEIPLLAYL